MHNALGHVKKKKKTHERTFRILSAYHEKKQSKFFAMRRQRLEKSGNYGGEKM